MPKLTDLVRQNEEKKKFTRKEYRPWNLSETISQANQKQDRADDNEFVEKVILTNPASALSDDRVVQIAPRSPKLGLNKQGHNEKDVINEFTRPENIELTVDDLLIQLSGRQKELLILIIRNLIDQHSLVTSPIYAKFLVEKISTSLGTIKNAVRRLEDKGLIKSLSKRARGGYYRFEVREEVVLAGQRILFRL